MSETEDSVFPQIYVGFSAQSNSRRNCFLTVPILFAIKERQRNDLRILLTFPTEDSVQKSLT